MVPKRALLILMLTLVPAAQSLAETTGKREKGASMIVFRSADGRTLTLEELKGATGTFRYEIIGAGNVPDEAAALHKRARTVGTTTGDYPLSIELLTKAAKLAPEWPYPIYDRAFTYMILGKFDLAREDYVRTVALAPRGFFTAIAAVDVLTREEKGEFPRGTYYEFVSHEWENDPAKRTQKAQEMVKRLPRFAPGWKELAMLLTKDSEKMAAIQKGLASDPDAHTRGMLQIQQALVLSRRGDVDGAINLLGELALDPKSTSATEELAKVNLALILDRKSRQN
jgi:tetratricopeptide (TPR) repeat protein